PWCRSRRLSSATRKPVLTSAFLAIAGRDKVVPPSGAQIDRQSIDGPDEIGDVVKGIGPPPDRPMCRSQPFTHDVRLRYFPCPGLSFALGYEGLGQTYGEGLHGCRVIRCRQSCKTTGIAGCDACSSMHRPSP